MKRKLQFRAWDTQENRMLDGDLTGDGHARSINAEILSLIERGFLLMQYTGLKDKNGVEIYEGDVVKCEKEEVVNPWVVDNHGGADWVIWNLLNTSYHLHQLEEDMEVIGNIYQSPELIK